MIIIIYSRSLNFFGLNVIQSNSAFRVFVPAVSMAISILCVFSAVVKYVKSYRVGSPPVITTKVHFDFNTFSTMVLFVNIG